MKLSMLNESPKQFIDCRILILSLITNMACLFPAMLIKSGSIFELTLFALI